MPTVTEPTDPPPWPTVKLVGLTVAVPMYVFYLYFVGRSQRLVSRLERAGIEIVNLIADAWEEEEFAPFRVVVPAPPLFSGVSMRCELALPQRSAAG
jgi:hypothetical protein